MKEILELSGATTLFVTHDQEEALYLGDRVAILNQGHLEQVGTSQAIYRTPTTSYVARFVGMADFLPVTYRESLFVIFSPADHDLTASARWQCCCGNSDCMPRSSTHNCPKTIY